MKNLKLKTLILSSLVASATIVPNLTSCSAKSTIKVDGATIDLSKSHIELDRDSTIYLIPNKDTKITGIKSITVGTTVLTRMAYKIEYEQANSTACKLTIFAKSMTSVDIAIEVLNTDIEIKEVNYNGDTVTTFAALNSYTLEVKAKYKDVEGDIHLVAGEYLVFDSDGKDITSQVLSINGYKMDKGKTYNFTIKAAVDTSKTKDLSVTITDPYKDPCEGVEYDSSDPRFDHECKVRIKESSKTLTGTIEPEKFYVFNGVEKKVTAIEDNGFKDCQASRIKFISDCEIASIQANAFTGCAAYLTTINIPCKVTSIEAGTFNNFTKLTTVYLDSQTIVDLTDDDSKLLASATTIYIKNGLTDPASTTYIAKNGFTKKETGTDYSKWTK